MMLRHTKTRAAHLPVATALALTIGLAAPLAASAADALRVVRDRETGELRAPNAAEIQAMQKAEAELKIARAARGEAVKPPVAGVETRFADGTVQRTLGEDDAMYSVATRRADGSTEMQCVPAAQAKSLVVKATRQPAAAHSHSGKAGHEHQ